MKRYRTLLICLALWLLADYANTRDKIFCQPIEEIVLLKTDSVAISVVEDSMRAIEIRAYLAYMRSPAYYKKYPPCAKFLGGGHSGCLWTIRDIPGLYALRPPDFENEGNSKIFSYRVVVERDGKKIARFFNKGGRFQKKLQEFIQYKVKRRDKLLFYNIKYQLKNGKIITLPSLEWIENRYSFDC